MTAPTGLTDLLRGAADDAVDHHPTPGPDGPDLWRRGRRTTWASRAVAAAMAATALALVVALGLAVHAPPVSMPAQGPAPYPEVVSDLFPGTHDASADVFGFVTTSVEFRSAAGLRVVERDGTLSSLPRDGDPTTSGIALDPGDGVPLAPDGRTVLVAEGLVDVLDGVLTRFPATADDLSPVTPASARWSPDSAHVLVATVDGPAVLDRRAVVVAAPGPDDRSVLPAGWAGPTTALGVRVGADGSRAELVARDLGAGGWRPLRPLDVQATGRSGPRAAYVSPDGDGLLLVEPTGRAVLAAVRTGAPVAFAGTDRADVVVWDACRPVWQGGQPLRSSGGLTRPGDGRPVMRFPDRSDARCVSLAGDALTGAPEPDPVGAEREQVWRVAWPTLTVLALVGAVWTVVAVRRSRRHGERFLPMILPQSF